MSHILDGPAAGVRLTLTRTPKLLRITQNGPCFRALDQLNDDTEPTELIYVYQRTGPRLPVTTATYQLLTPQPFDNQIRETEDWREWNATQLRLNVHTTSQITP